MVKTVLEVLEEKIPESPWHNFSVKRIKEPLEEHLRQREEAFLFRDLFFEYEGKGYTPDIAIVLKGAPPLKTSGLFIEFQKTDQNQMSSLKSW